MTHGEEKVLVSLAENGGEMFQSDIVRHIRLSRSRASEILSSLEKRSLVSRFQLGRNYRVVLKTEARRANYVQGRKLLRMGFTRAAEYPYVIPFRKRMKDDLGIDVDLRIYENGLDVARDLSLRRLDLGIVPILAGFMFCSLRAPFKIISPAGSGGSCIVSLNRGGKQSSISKPKVATTKLTTMELLLNSSLKKHFLPDGSEVVYASGPGEIVNGFASKRLDAACIWEPYASLLEKKYRLSRIVSYSEIGEHLCCVFAAGNHLNDHILRKVVSKFRGSVSEFLKNPHSFLTQYSALIDFDDKIVREVSKEYGYPQDIEPRIIIKQFERAGIQIPNPSTVKDMIRSAE